MAQTYRNNNQRNNQNQQTRKQNAPAIRAKIDRLVDGDGNTRAYASINVAGAVAIHGIRVMDSRKGLFVSMPNRSYKDSNGNTQYSDIAHAVTKEVREAITKLQDMYTVRGSAIQIMEIAGGYQMCTKPEYGRWVRRLYNEKMTTRLSNAALETLAIIAYKQPLTRAEMEAIRGVDVAGPLEKLLDRGLVRVVGRKETIGHPMVYGTTDEFLRMFGLNKVTELPDLQVFAAKNLEDKQEDLPFGEPLPPLGQPRIIPLEELEGEERLEALEASTPDPFFKRNSYNQGDLTLAGESASTTADEGLPFEDTAATSADQTNTQAPQPPTQEEEK